MRTPPDRAFFSDGPPPAECFPKHPSVACVDAPNSLARRRGSDFLPRMVRDGRARRCGADGLELRASNRGEMHYELEQWSESLGRTTIMRTSQHAQTRCSPKWTRNMGPQKATWQPIASYCCPPVPLSAPVRYTPFTHERIMQREYDTGVVAGPNRTVCSRADDSIMHETG